MIWLESVNKGRSPPPLRRSLLWNLYSFLSTAWFDVNVSAIFFSCQSQDFFLLGTDLGADADDDQELCEVTATWREFGSTVPGGYALEGDNAQHINAVVCCAVLCCAVVCCSVLCCAAVSKVNKSESCTMAGPVWGNEREGGEARWMGIRKFSADKRFAIGSLVAKRFWFTVAKMINISKRF